jgi:uncharacterized membrane protein YcaP (DUF421 family)
VVILGFDIEAAFVPDVSLFEMVARGVIVYLAIFILLRVVLRNRMGTLTTSDVLVLVLIADAAQNAVASEYRSITDGVVLIATIIGMSFLFDWLGYHVAFLGRLVHPQRKPLVANGRVLWKTLKAELTEEELLTQLRLEGAGGIGDVRAAYLEGNGEISVIRRAGA